MAKYTPRTKEPSTTDKNFIHMSSGGYNRCIVIKNGSCLPNCVGYSWGRWREILGKNPNLSLNNAENWWAHNDGYERGQTPKLGAVICWRKGLAGNASDGAGHVAVVEEVKSKLSLVSKSRMDKKLFVLANVENVERASELFKLGADSVLTPYADEIGDDLLKRFNLINK